MVVQSLCLGLGFFPVLFLDGIPVMAQEETVPGRQLGRPGYLVIEAVRDSTAGFTWTTGPGPGFRSLIWDQGRLTLPDSLVVEDFSHRDIGITCTAQLAGIGGSGQLVLRDGIYPVSEPLILSDGLLELEITGGEIEIRGARIRYRRAVAETRASKSGLLMLAGMTLLVVVLLRRARLKSAERMGT